MASSGGRECARFREQIVTRIIRQRSGTVAPKERGKEPLESFAVP